MKRIFLFLVLFFLFFIFLSKKVYADDLCDIHATGIVSGQKTTITLTNKTDQEETYTVSINPPGGVGGATGVQRFCKVTVPAHATKTLTSPKVISEVGIISIAAYKYTSTPTGVGCSWANEGPLRCSGTFTSKRGDLTTECQVTATDIHPGEATTVKVKNLSDRDIFVRATVSGPGEILGAFGSWDFYHTLKKGEIWTFQHTLSPSGAGPYNGKVDVSEPHYDRAGPVPVMLHSTLLCNTKFLIATDLEEAKKILKHFRPDECTIDGNEGIQTALGCIPTEIQPLVSWLFKYAISIAGGIAFLMIIFAAFQMITSSGDPEKLEKAKQMLGSAIAGLLFIIFAVFLLRIIGVDILKIF